MYIHLLSIVHYPTTLCTILCRVLRIHRSSQYRQRPVTFIARGHLRSQGTHGSSARGHTGPSGTQGPSLCHSEPPGHDCCGLDCRRPPALLTMQPVRVSPSPVHHSDPTTRQALQLLVYILCRQNRQVRYDVTNIHRQRYRHHVQTLPVSDVTRDRRLR